MSRAVACALSIVCAIAAPGLAEPPVEEDYVLHCSACHGLDGSGVRDVVPGLAGTGEIARLPGGRAYLMSVPGAAQAPVDDARLARLLNWVVAEFGGVVMDPPLNAFHEPLDYLPAGRWYEQFAGTDGEAQLRVGRDIHGVVGSTLSARAASDAVRHALAFYELLLEPTIAKRQPTSTESAG